MSWEHVRGHDSARQQLLKAYRRGRLAHAYLFVGPEGVGKKLFAVELAKALFCERPPAELTACNHCHACVQIVAGTYADFHTAERPEDKLELPIATVRALCQELGLKPTRGSRKVVVLDDADSFNEESANAFLKTLEEPTPGSILILIATSIEQQLPTILSRCQVIRFQPLSRDDLRAVLVANEIVDSIKQDRLILLAAGSAAQALALNDDELWNFRETMMAGLLAAKPDPVRMAQGWIHFIEEAGKEGSAQRQRASLAIRLLIDSLRRVLRLALHPEATQPDDTKLIPLATRAGADRVAGMIEYCTEADYQIDRRVTVALIVEQLTDRLARNANATTPHG